MAMPYTFSHPLAVVPFRRFCPVWLNFAALVIGSMSPDFGYFVDRFEEARFAHTIVGTFAICLPAGLLVFGIFYLLRRPLCFLLPQPHRGALTPVAKGSRFSVRGFITVPVSVLIGAWTHTIWDSFTHYYGWTAQHIAVLREAAIHIGNMELHTCSVLQHLSTLAGAGGLALLYFLWLSRRPREVAIGADSFSDRARYTILASLVLISMAIAMLAAFHKTGAPSLATDYQTFIFWTAIYSIDAFVPLLVISSLMVYVMRAPT
jgi:hypothetical protein